ncbi:MAG: undecaprenyl-diphosphatase UppP [Pirellulales bacterium]|jgi:undecaprenyl-diphosphatase
MSIFQAIILGIVQGLTEFLPISSTAHLLIVPWLFGWSDPGAAFSAVIQTGTLLAVFVALRKDVVALIQGFVQGLISRQPWATPHSRVAWLVVFGTIPIVVVGFLARDLVRGDARQIELVATMMVVVALAMAAAEWLCHRRVLQGTTGRDGIEAVTFRDGLVMGLAQVLALVPGTSRSGVTIVSGVFTGLDRATAARFSFLLSLPAISAAAMLEAWQQREDIFGTREDAAAIAIGTLTALVVGYVSIRWLLAMLTRHTLWPFVVYRVLLAAGLTAMLFAGG